MDTNSARPLNNCTPVNKEIPEVIRQDLLLPMSEHQSLAAAIKSLVEQPATEQEIFNLANFLEGLQPDQRTINAAADQIFSGGSVRFTAISLHLTNLCTRGTENAFSAHWQRLHPEVRAGIAKVLTDRLLVLRERAAVIHNASGADINQTIEELLQKLDALPLSVRSQLTNAILADTLSVSPVTMINKLDMLAEEMPEQVDAELQRATRS